jgi:hypothetical protein
VSPFLFFDSKTCPLLAHEVLLAVVGHRVLGKMDSLMLLKSKGSAKSLPDGSQNGIQKNIKLPFSIFENIYWKELGLLPFVWIAFFTPIFNLLQLSVLTGEVGVGKSSREKQGLANARARQDDRFIEDGVDYTIPNIMAECWGNIMEKYFGLPRSFSNLVDKVLRRRRVCYEPKCHISSYFNTTFISIGVDVWVSIGKEMG